MCEKWAIQEFFDIEIALDTYSFRSNLVRFRD